MNLSIECLSLNYVKEQKNLPPALSFLIGRSTPDPKYRSVQIALPLPSDASPETTARWRSISRTHAQVTREPDGRYLVEDVSGKDYTRTFVLSNGNAIPCKGMTELPMKHYPGGGRRGTIRLVSIDLCLVENP